MNRRYVGALAGGVALLLAATECWATVVRVPADQPTIQAGIDAASDGDHVLVSPGVYQGVGNRDLVFSGKQIVVRSEGGAQWTTIDCQGSASEHHRAFDFLDTYEPLGAAVEGFEIVNGYSDEGGGIRINSSAVSVRRCVFRACTGYGGALYLHDAPLSNVEECRIEQCGDPALSANTVGTIIDCEVVESTGRGVELLEVFRLERCLVSGSVGDAIETYNATEQECVVKGCVVTGNRRRGIDAWWSPKLVVDGCTIAGNRYSGLRVDESNGLHVANTVISGNCSFDLEVVGDISVSCSAIDPDEISAYGEIEFLDPLVTDDPMFCVPLDCELAPVVGGDYRLSPGSPCLAENSPCGEQIGALGPGCGDPSAAPDPVVGDSELDHGQLGIVAFGVQQGADLRFRVTGEPRGACLVELVDPTGRRVGSRVLERAEGGAEVHWDLREDARALGSGVYFLRVSDGAGAEAVAKFVWLR